MYSFFSRHEVDKKATGFSAGEEGYPSPGRVAWDLWGGDAGYSWSRAKWASIQRQRENKSDTPKEITKAVSEIDLDEEFGPIPPVPTEEEHESRAT